MSEPAKSAVEKDISKLFPKLRELARDVHSLKHDVKSIKLRLNVLEDLARKQIGA
ncbi:hypothetical protein LCGC14_2731680 [marine sediment metagenome]|uniref:Uncharacterized protein n=1 Tax=marine sediment metagenome TaxID=412755 RepID=A0A0F8Z755_9ZZZZ